MNIKNNKRKKESQNKIENVFIKLVQTKEVNEITVTDICNEAMLNRSTFYANYLDIFDLIEKISDRMLEDLHMVYADEETNHYNSYDFLKLFQHIKDNQLFYKTYFKLGLDRHFKPIKYDINDAEKYYDNKHIKYHIEYSRAGITSIIKIWLEDDCNLSPEEVFDILKAEYETKH